MENTTQTIPPVRGDREVGSRSYLFSIVLVAVIGGLLFGYDTAVISGAEKGLQAFFMGAQDFQYTDFMHGFTSSSALIGCIIGSAISGLLTTRYGRKLTLILAGVLFFISAWGSMCPETMVLAKGEPNMTLFVVFNIYRVIGGIGVGLASAVCPMYIGEIAPSGIRGMLVSWNQFAIIFGQLVVYFVNYFILGDHIAPIIQSIGEGFNQLIFNEKAVWTAETGWRYMFGSEMIPAGLFAILICFVPETPRYLVSIGKTEKAEGILAKINGTDKAKSILEEIKETMTEKAEPVLTYGWICLFVGIMLSVFQQAVGINAVLYFAPRIYESMGFDDPMKLTVFTGIINLAFTVVAIFTVEKLGRKPLLIIGSLGMAIGALGVALTFSTSEKYIASPTVIINDNGIIDVTLSEKNKVAVNPGEYPNGTDEFVAAGLTILPNRDLIINVENKEKGVDKSYVVNANLQQKDGQSIYHFTFSHNPETFKDLEISQLYDGPVQTEEGYSTSQLLCMIFLMLYAACFMFSWGPICWVLIAEVFPNTIRGAAVAIAVAFQWIFNWIVSTSFVPMANSLGYWFVYGMYGIICILAAVFVWRLVPETKGKTLEDMTALWGKKNNA